MGSTVSYAGHAQFPKHSLEYSLNFWSHTKKNHEHVKRQCPFSLLLVDIVRKAFWFVVIEFTHTKRFRNIFEDPLLSLTTTQELLLLAGLRAQSHPCCDAKYQCTPSMVYDFMPHLLGTLEAWRAESNMSRGAERTLMPYGSFMF